MGCGGKWSGNIATYENGNATNPIKPLKKQEGNKKDEARKKENNKGKEKKRKKGENT